MMSPPQFGHLTVVFAEHPKGPVEPIVVVTTDDTGRSMVAMYRKSESRAAPIAELIRATEASGNAFNQDWYTELDEFCADLGATVATREMSYVGRLEDVAARAYERLVLQACIPTVDVIGVPWDSSAQRTRMAVDALDADIPSELASMHNMAEKPLNSYPGFYTYVAEPSARGGVGDPILVVVGTNDGRTLAVGRRGQEVRGGAFWAFVKSTRTLRLDDAPTRGADGPYTRAWVDRMALELRNNYRIASAIDIWVRDGRTEATALMHSLVAREPATIVVKAIGGPGLG